MQRIVADLADAGYLTRSREGRRNRYRVNDEMPLRHLETQHRRVRELLLLLAKDAGTPVPPRAECLRDIPSLDSTRTCVTSFANR